MTDSIIFLIIGLAVGAVLGYLVSRVMSKNTSSVTGADTSQLEHKIKTLEQEKMGLLSEKSKLEGLIEQSRVHFAEIRANLKTAEEKVAELTATKEQNRFLQEKLTDTKKEVEELQQRFAKEFENIANRILDEKTKKFTEQNKTNMDVILNPLKDNIKRFEEQVQKSYKAESDERITLKTEIKNLIDLNKQISEEANNLTKALKGENKTQGNWGELILEKVLERSGLVKDQEYRLQYSTNNDGGKRIQPDAVIMLPDNKHIIVDAKVSLVAYEALVSCTDDQREGFLKEHLLSVRSHVKNLSEKNYTTSADFNSPDFVLLFIPIESSFSLAVQADQEIFNFAWDKKIVIVSPSTLLATLRTIASVWKQERQTKNAIEIAKQSGALYDKFVGFLEDMEKIGKSLDSSHTAYEAAMNKLSKGTGNLVKRAQDIEKLGAKNTKDIPNTFIE